MPEPYLKSIPSVFASSRIDCIVSWTELMKQAETCGCVLDAAVEPHRRVERDHLVEEQVGQLGLEGLGVLLAWRSSRPRVPSAPPSWPRGRGAAGRECSRSGRPERARGSTSAPRRWWRAATRTSGTSTLRCSKATSPVPLEITASRSSHSTSSYGWTPGFVKRRERSRSACGRRGGRRPRRWTEPVRSSWVGRGSR